MLIAVLFPSLPLPLPYFRRGRGGEVISRVIDGEVVGHIEPVSLIAFFEVK